MASGTWKIFNPQANAYETLDKSLAQHQTLLRGSIITLRDDGFSGTTTQDTDWLPVSGDYNSWAAPVDRVTYTAGTIIPVFGDPLDGGDLMPMNQGGGGVSATGTVSSVADASRASNLMGPIPSRVKWRIQGLVGAGTIGLLVVIMRTK